MDLCDMSSTMSGVKGTRSVSLPARQGTGPGEGERGLGRLRERGSRTREGGQEVEVSDMKGKYL